MRSIWIFAFLTAVNPPGTASADPSAAQYEILESHPGCTGLGNIAYIAEISTKLTKAEYFTVTSGFGGEDRGTSCQVKERRAGNNEDRRIPCPGEQEAQFKEYERLDAFCRSAPSRPELDVGLKAEFVGCLSLDGHRLVAGNWELQLPDGLSAKSTKGTFDDPRLLATLLLDDDMSTEPAQSQLFVAFTVEEVALALSSDDLLGIAGSVTVALVDPANSALTSEALPRDVDILELPDPAAPQAMICRKRYGSDGIMSPEPIGFSDVFSP